MRPYWHIIYVAEKKIIFDLVDIIWNITKIEIKPFFLLLIAARRSEASREQGDDDNNINNNNNNNNNYVIAHNIFNRCCRDILPAMNLDCATTACCQILSNSSFILQPYTLKSEITSAS